MTIEEFMRDIAPKMNEGWVAMDKDGTGERTFVEIPNGDTIYIERKLLVPVPLLFNAEKKFQEQVKACIQLKEREKLMTLDKIFSFFKKFNFFEVK